MYLQLCQNNLSICVIVSSNHFEAMLTRIDQKLDSLVSSLWHSFIKKHYIQHIIVRIIYFHKSTSSNVDVKFDSISNGYSPTSY